MSKGIKIKAVRPHRRAIFPPEPEWGMEAQVVNLSGWLADSIIQKVILSPNVLKQVEEWVALSLEATVIHEVGGFLLGAWREDEPGSIEVYLAEFSPATQADDSSPNRLVLDKNAMAELDRQQATNPEWETIGWLHTHPGMGPYLSEVDLPPHKAYFGRKQDLAIVIDPTTPGFDTGIFTQKRDGTQNNQQDYQSSWLSWKQWTR